MNGHDAPRLNIVDVRLYERPVRLRLPFRFGVVTLTEAPQAFARVRIRTADGREGWGMAAEVLAPKWFDKDLALSNEDNFAQLRLALALAAAAYRAVGPATAFGHFAATYRAHLTAGAARRLNPLVAGYGPALLDRAVLDALLRLHGLSFYDGIRRNLPGLAVGDLTPDLAGFDADAFLAGLAPSAAIEARHTVGLTDPIVENPRPLGDGLPETLQDVVGRYGCRWYKVKVAGDPAGDVARLKEIAAVLDATAGDYRVTLDGNEQYRDAAGVAELLGALAGEPALQRFREAILFVEQPIARDRALAEDVTALSLIRPVIVDESDATLDSYPEAKARGYRGVSSKSCKGFYKSLLNAARTARWNAEAGGPRFLMSGEDLTTQAGIAVQQDLALASLLGLGHVERNGHHYVNGMAGAPEAEQRAFLEAHPDLYQRSHGAVRLKLRDGRLAIGSLGCPGFASAVHPDTAGMAAMALPAL